MTGWTEGSGRSAASVCQNGGGMMEVSKRTEGRTETGRKQKAKENFLKIICRVCQKVSEKIGDIQFHFYFFVGQNTEEKM